MLLKSVIINKYKCFTIEQDIPIDPKVTRIVGKNESGKTALLEALAKYNYFEEDPRFDFDEQFDYPKNEWKKFQKTNEDQEVVRCTFELEQEDMDAIEKDVGKGVLHTKEFSHSVFYRGDGTFEGITTDEGTFLKAWLKSLEIDDDTRSMLAKVNTIREIKEAMDGNEELLVFSDEITRIASQAYDWDNLLDGYVAKQHIHPRMPKFWYFDEYLTLPGRIDLQKVASNLHDADFTEDNLKISKALIELSGINLQELLQAASFESFISELEATSNEISDELFEYWKTNQNLQIRFEVEVLPQPGSPADQRRFLNVRIRNTNHRVSLPLGNRSRGFVWFFSFLVWFSKVQEDRSNRYVLLLDEPGLNLHAAAQADLLRYIDDKLSGEYQVLYTTHSPFMIDSGSLHQVRTVLDTLDAKQGSAVSDSIQEKDPDTLFPLQAALGYDIAQNLFIGKKNLLVEGPADLLFIEAFKRICEETERETLNSDITIVPVGGLDKVTSFISLLRGNRLQIVCLLDTFLDQKGKRRLDDLISQKIINGKDVLFFDEFIDGAAIAEVEDLFDDSEYLSLFNDAFPEHKDITDSDLSDMEGTLPRRIAQVLNVSRYNHYRPAVQAVKVLIATEVSENTILRFERIFSIVNKRFR